MPLRAIYRRAVGRGEVTVNPTTGVELPAVRSRRDRIASPAEAATLLAAIPTRDRALWATAMYGPAPWRTASTSVGGRRPPNRRHPGRALLGSERGADRDEEPRRSAGGADRRRPARLPRRAQARIRPPRRPRVRPDGGRALRPARARSPSRNCVEAGDSEAARADLTARVPAHVRQPDDRGGREREGARHIHGSFVGHGHARPVRASHAR
jgi:hypothetical protein